MWELYEKVMVPIPIGMNGVYYDLSVEKFKFWARHIPEDDWDELLEFLNIIKTVHNKFESDEGKGATFEEEDFQILIEADKDGDGSGPEEG